MDPTVIKIKELDLDVINPRTSNYMDPDSYGSKILVIGKPGTGKSTLIASILYAKKHIFPIGMVFSGTEDSNGFFKKILPSTFIYNEYNPEKIENFSLRESDTRR